VLPSRFVVQSRLLAGALLIFSLPACGGSSGSRQPSWRRAEVASSAARGPLVVRFAPDSPGARAYNDPPIRPPPESSFADAIVREVARASVELGVPAPVPDGRLYAAAAELAAITPADGPLVYSLIEFALQRHGIIEPSPHLIVIWGPVGDGQEIATSLRERLPAILGAARFARLGLGVAKREGGQEVTILAFQSSFIETSPIPRRLEPGGRAPITFTVAKPYVNPEVFVTRARGDVERLPLRRNGASGFASELGCGAHRGRQQLEITAHDETGSTVMANFPVWCAEEPPAELTVQLDGEDNAPVASGEEAEERLVRMVNRDRERHGLAPLVVDRRLARVASAHSEDMRATGVVAHVSPRTGSAADRVRAGGIKSSVVLENVARAYGVSEAQEGLMNSPGHRANILSAEATHVGIGVVLGEDVAGRRELFVTQLFIRKSGPIDRAQTRELVRQKVRTLRGIDEDTRLSQVAGEVAASMATGRTAAQASQAANRKLDALNLSYAKVTTVVTTVASLDAFNPQASLSDRSIRAFGLGISQGDHDVMGEHAIHIVLLLGHQ
jgi:uncharacterized protein YkwD